MMTKTEEIVASKEMALDLMDVLAAAGDLEVGAPLAARQALDTAWRTASRALCLRLREERHPGACSALAKVREAVRAFSWASDDAGDRALVGEDFDEDVALGVMEDARLAFDEVAAAVGILARVERASQVAGYELAGMCSR